MLSPLSQKQPISLACSPPSCLLKCYLPPFLHPHPGPCLPSCCISLLALVTFTLFFAFAWFAVCAPPQPPRECELHRAGRGSARCVSSTLHRTGIAERTVQRGRGFLQGLPFGSLGLTTRAHLLPSIHPNVASTWVKTRWWGGKAENWAPSRPCLPPCLLHASLRPGLADTDWREGSTQSRRQRQESPSRTPR